MFPKLRFLLILTCLSVLTVGCGTQKDIAGASAAVTQFYGQLDQRDYLSIYNNADARFRGASSKTISWRS